MTKPLTGRTVFVIFASCFAVIIGVNLALAVNAVRTFPGLETDNAYVASQTFDTERRAQMALGWTVEARLTGDEVTLAVTGRGGAPVYPAEITAILGRATAAADDRPLDFRRKDGLWVAAAPTAPGRWTLRLEMRAADGTKFRQILPLRAEVGA